MLDFHTETDFQSNDALATPLQAPQIMNVALNFNFAYCYIDFKTEGIPETYCNSKFLTSAISVPFSCTQMKGV